MNWMPKQNVNNEKALGMFKIMIYIYVRIKMYRYSIMCFNKSKGYFSAGILRFWIQFAGTSTNYEESKCYNA